MITTLKNHQQANSLAQSLVHAQAAYYNSDEPHMTDDEYDAKVALLDAFEKSYGAVKVKWRKVGAEVPAGYRKVKHLFPMQSLKTLTDTSIETLWDFIKSLLPYTLKESFSIVIEPKWDGLALSAYYFNNALQQLATRGDGIEGEDVSRLMKGRIIDLPHQINHVDGIEVRGELLISRKNFEAVNALRRRDGKDEYDNTRNAVAGIVRMLTGANEYLDLLTFRAYDVMSTNNEFTSFEEKGAFLKKQGFTYVSLGTDVFPGPPTDAKDFSIAATYALYEAFGERRANFEYDTDGVVYKLNNLLLAAKIPSTATQPGWAAAHKYSPEEAITVLEDIRLGIGRTGRVTPVALLKAVRVGGVEVTSASLKNEDEIKKLDVRIGETVMVFRAGDVIPEIKSAIVLDPKHRPAAYVFPTHCPECGGFLTRHPDEAHHYCNNRSRCPDQMEAYWEYVTSRPVLNVVGFGPSTVKKLMEIQAINLLPDLWELTEAKFLEAGVGEADSKKLAAEITRINKLVDLWRVYTALGIRGVATSTAKDLARAYPTINLFVAATQADLETIDGIGPITAGNIAEYIRSENGIITLARLNGMLKDSLVTQMEGDEKAWLGTAVITGQFDGYTRDEVTEMVESVMFYKVVERLTKDTDELIVGNRPSKDKVAKAKSLGVHLMTDVTFKRL